MKESMPKISVIIPVYNAEKYLSESIESILKQKFEDFELILINDGSKDKSDQIIERFANQDHRIKVITNESNIAVPKTRNIGIKEARGKYIAWQDADDISMPDRLELQYKYLESHPDVGIVGGYLQFFDEGGEDLFVRKYPEGDQDLRSTIFLYSPVSQGVSMVRKEILEEVGGYNEKLAQAEDLDVSFRVGTVSKFANIQKVLLRCRFHPKSLSTNKMRENIDFTLKVRKNALKYGYKMNLRDKISFAGACIIKFFPPKFIFWAFNLLRNNR